MRMMVRFGVRVRVMVIEVKSSDLEDAYDG